MLENKTIKKESSNRLTNGVKKGLTTIELLIAASVLVLLATIILGAMRNFRDERELGKAVDDIMNIIREARSQTLASKGGSQFGIHFDTYQVILFKGASFSSGDPDNEILTLSGQVEIFNINISGNDTVFERLTGNASPSGDISVRLISDTSRSETIIITSTGLVYVQ